MSAMGHEQTSRHVRVMSIIPLEADIHQRGLHVRFVPSGHHNGHQLDRGRATPGAISLRWRDRATAL
jgi:hypothetical protein